MNVLCGKASYATVSGVVRFNGQEGDFNDYKTVMGFVPQEDVVHEGLTVGEQIRFSADLRNASDTDVKTRKLITEDVLKVMQLDGIQNSIVSGLEHRGISGGQRKRVSIGLELAADPTMLFLDEPTSGLDAEFPCDSAFVEENDTAGSHKCDGGPSAAVFPIFAFRRCSAFGERRSYSVLWTSVLGESVLSAPRF